eukprot:gene31381-6542_t
MPIYAVYYYRRAAALRPTDARMWCALGQCYIHEQVNMTDLAIRCYRRAIEHNDPDGIAVHMLAKLYEGRHDDAQAEKLSSARTLARLDRQDGRIVLVGSWRGGGPSTFPWGTELGGGYVVVFWRDVASLSDTRPCRQLEREGLGATILIHEATFEHDLHTMASYRTILTHFSQRYPRVPTGIPRCSLESLMGDVLSPLRSRPVVAFDGMVVPLSSLPELPLVSGVVSMVLLEEGDGADGT